MWLYWVSTVYVYVLMVRSMRVAKWDRDSDVLTKMIGLEGDIMGIWWVIPLLYIPIYRWLVMTITWSGNSDSSSLPHHFFRNQKTRQRWTAPDGPQRQHVDVHQSTGHPGDRSRELPGPPGRPNTADVGDSWVSIDGAVAVILVCCNTLQYQKYDSAR